MNISSIVVKTIPKYLDEVVENLKKCEACDYHFHDEKGHIIVTIEGEDVSEELSKLRVIEEIPHVITADMQMSYLVGIVCYAMILMYGVKWHKMRAWRKSWQK